MTLFKLAMKNIRKSMKDYAIYFFTLILGVTIFYVFNTIESQTVMLQVSESMYEIIDLMNAALSVVSVFVAVILGGLIIYASRFLMKRRKKEFGIYLTLGMSKRKVSGILFTETLLIGLLSLVVGLLLGIVLSQFMSIVVANVFDADMSRFTFTFSGSAFRRTILYFGIMYVLVILFNTLAVGRYRLIDLLQGARKNEQPKLKNPGLCTIIFVLACCALGYAYYMVTHRSVNMTEKTLVAMIVIGGVSTFFIFWSVSGLLLKVFMGFRNTYFRGLNSFVLRQFSGKINTMVFSTTVICLMLFITICMLGSALSLSNSMNANLRELAPVDVEMYKRLNLEGDVPPAIMEDSHTDIMGTLQNNHYDVAKELKDVTSVNMYHLEELTLGSFCGEYLEELSKSYLFLQPEKNVDVMTVSDYNRVAALFGHPTFSLQEDEYIIVADLDRMVEVHNLLLREGKAVTVDGRDYHSKYDSCQPGAVEIAVQHLNVGVILLPDEALAGKSPYENILLGNYIVEDKAAKAVSEQNLRELMEAIYNQSTWMIYDTKIDIAETSIGLGALVTFIGLYLGVIFLIASAAVLALKELSESADNVERYAVLRKLGTDERMLDQALFRQMGISFLFPLLLAVIHAVFGLQFANIVLETFGTKGLSSSLATTALIIVVIYGGYFLVTYFGSRRMIRDEGR